MHIQELTVIQETLGTTFNQHLGILELKVYSVDLPDTREHNSVRTTVSSDTKAIKAFCEGCQNL